MKSTNKINPEDIESRGLEIQDIVAYVKSRGWQPVPDPWDKFLIFDGPLDKQGKPIRLTLPLRDQPEIMPLRLSVAINQLAAVERRSAEEVLTDLS